jgi:hypothetical protein
MKLRAFFSILLAGVALAACSADGSGTLPAPRGLAAVRSAAASAYAFAPYVDMTAYPPFSVAAGSKQTGTQYYTLAFVVSKGNACTGAWGGIVVPTDPTYGPYVRKQFAAIRARGGDAILSFGGAAGSELALTCPDAASLAAAYQADIDYYGVSHVDFDIEGAAVDDLPSVARRSAALAAMEAHYAQLGKPISVSYTLPVNPTGMPGDVLNVVKSAIAAGAAIDIVNIMTMDFYGSAPNPKGRMADYAIESARSTAKQLKNAGFPLGSNPYASIGVTPMIGVNDDPKEIFEPADARRLLAWARQNGLGRLSFWAAQRDKACKHGAQDYASDVCSGIAQKPGEFSKILAPF